VATETRNETDVDDCEGSAAALKGQASEDSLAVRGAINAQIVQLRLLVILAWLPLVRPAVCPRCVLGHPPTLWRSITASFVEPDVSAFASG
jgi:hypothetical protein